MQNNAQEFQNVIDSFAGTEPSSNQDASTNGTPATSQTTQEPQTQSQQPASSNAGQTNNTEQTLEGDGQTRDDNSTIKQMRDQIKKSNEEANAAKARLEKLARLQGMSVDELEAKLQAEEDKKNATAKGIPTEVEEQIRTMQNRIRELEETNRAQNFNNRANQLMAKYNLNPDQFMEFAQTMMSKGFDVRSENMDLDLLYRSSNFDSLLAQAKAEERQAVLNEIQNQRNNSNGVQTRPGTNKAQQQTGNREVTRDELQDFLNSLSK